MKYIRYFGMMALLVVLSLPSFAQRRGYDYNYLNDDRTFWRFQSLPSSSRNGSRNYDYDRDDYYYQGNNRSRSGRNSGSRGRRDDDYSYQNQRSQSRVRVSVEFDSRGNRISNYNAPHRRGQYDDRYDERRSRR